MGHGIRFPTGEASTPLSAVRTSLKSESPPDPSLMVMGSLIPPDWGGSGLPPDLGDEVSRPALVTAGQFQRRRPHPTAEAVFFRHPSMVEDQRNLCAPKDNTLVAKEFDTRMAQLQYRRKKNKSLTRASGDRPHF